MESNSLRSPSVLNHVDTNVQSELVRRSSPLSASKSTKNSSSSSDNEMECGDIANDQENKPPGSVESASSTDSFKFKKPLPRESFPSEDNTLNSLIDGLSHLKLGSTSVTEKRFNSSKWTTPLKKKSAQPSESRAFSDCSFEKKSPPSALNDEKPVENILVADSSNKPDEETSIVLNDDDCSDYYDCEEVNVGEQARTGEFSDNCNTADSSFHSVLEKEYAATLAADDSAVVMDNSESVNQANIAEMNRTQNNDQAYILEKYLTEQDFKLEISLSDVSFNTMGSGLDFELGKRQSVCSQTENPTSGALFSFENEEKAKFCSIVNLDVNDVTILPDQFNDMDLFAKENDRQNEDALFNVLSECSVRNETCSMFEANPEENLFALGRLSQAGFLRINTVEEEDALIQDSARRSPQLQASDSNLDPNDKNESEEDNVPVESVPTQMNVEVELASDNMELEEDVSVNEVISKEPSFSYPQQTNSVQFSSSFRGTDHSEEITNEQTSTFEESLIANNQPSSNSYPEAITTIDEILTEMNKNPKKLNETVELSGRTPSPSSLNATIDTESICDDSFTDKPNLTFDFESTRNTERDLERSTDLPKLNLTADLEASRNFSLEIEGENSNVTVNFEGIRTAEDNLVDQSQDALKSSIDTDSETSQDTLVNRTVYFEATELAQETNVENSPNREIQHDSFGSETSPESVINLAERSRESLENLVTNSEIADVKVDDGSTDLKQSKDFVDPEVIPSSSENLAEQCQKLAEVIDERGSRSEDVELSESVDSKSASMINDDFLVLDQTRFKPIRTVGLNLDITQIISNETSYNRDDTENGLGTSEVTDHEIFDFPTLNKTRLKPIRTVGLNLDINQIINNKTTYNQDDLENDLKASEVTNHEIDDRSHEAMGSSQIENLEITRVDEKISEDITRSSDLNNTVALEIGEKPLDSFPPVQISSKHNETINLETTRVIDDNVAGNSDNLNETVQLEPKIIENASENIQEESHLTEPFDMEVTRTFEETHDISTGLETSTGVEVNSSAFIQEPSRLNETVDMEVDEIIEENPKIFADTDKPNQTIDLSTSTMVANDPSVSVQNPTEFNETVDLKTNSPTYEDTIPYSSETVILEYDPDSYLKMDEIATVLPIFSTKSVLKSNSIEITKNDLAPATTSSSNLNYDNSNISMETEVNEEAAAGSSNLAEDQLNERELLDGSILNVCDDTVIIHETPGRRCNSPARFDRYAASMPEPASPIPPNSPIELTNKWQTHFDLSSVTDQLESYASRDSPPNSGDEMDETDPVDSNIAPEMLQVSKLPPGINRSISNLESIPEMNETDLNEEQSTFGVSFKQDTKDENPLEAVNTTAEAIPSQTVTSTSSVVRDNGNESSSTLTQTSPQPIPESGLNISIAAVPNKLNDSIFKTPITIKSLPRSDLSALNDSNFNADYFCARTASAKSTQRNSLVSPKLSSFKKSPPTYSPFFTPTRRLKQGTPKTSGNILPSLLDMSIGCFENYTANQLGSNTVPDNELNKTVDVDEEPRIEETKLLCLDDPHKKINVKTQTHNTELIDLQAENAKLKEDLINIITIAETLAHNEAELKKTVEQLEDNNRILNNKYELLTEYSNQLLARRNTELDEAEEKIRVLEAQLQEYTKKPKASSK